MRLLLLAATVARLAVHPLHTTHTDLVDEGGGRVRVTIRTFTDDLHAAVARRDAAAGDSAVARYVRNAISLRDRAGTPAALTWDSARREGDITLLSLHAILPGGLRGASVRQTMQMELYDDQVNVLQAQAGRSTSLLFLPGDGFKALP